MCILALCQHKCFSRIIHASLSVELSALFSLLGRVCVCVCFILFFYHLLALFTSVPFHYRFKFLLFDCFSISILSSIHFRFSSNEQSRVFTQSILHVCIRLYIHIYMKLFDKFVIQNNNLRNFCSICQQK